MVSLKSKTDIEVMREACRITGMTLNFIGEMIKPGITTREISNAAEKAKADINSATEKASEYARELRASVQNKTKDGINEVVNIIIA